MKAIYIWKITNRSVASIISSAKVVAATGQCSLLLIKLTISVIQLIDFIAKHVNDPFVLIGDQSVRSWIARELVSNLLALREYAKAFNAKLIIERERIYTENWNRSDGHGRIDPENYTPQPKNPIIAKFFMNIGRADQLGSGVRNLYKYTKLYSGGEPELIEGDIFKTIIPLVPPSKKQAEKLSE